MIGAPAGVVIHRYVAVSERRAPVNIQEMMDPRDPEAINPNLFTFVGSHADCIATEGGHVGGLGFRVLRGHVEALAICIIASPMDNTQKDYARSARSFGARSPCFLYNFRTAGLMEATGKGP